MKVLCLRLSNSRDTSASSTHRVLAELARAADPQADVDFAFLPPRKAPRVTGLFSRRDWADFDLILATNSFVQESVNLPWLLHANGLSPWASGRPECFPPLLLGGSNAFAAQGLARADGQAVPDAFFFGEAEESLPAFLRRWLAAAGSKRGRLQQAASGCDGFWVTGQRPEAPVRQAVARTFAALPSAPLPLADVETAGTARVPVGAGCASFCSFCFEGFERKPYREFALADILAQAQTLKRNCGARTAELDAFNLNTHAELGALVERAVRLFDKVSFKSQRADGVAACPAIIDLERAAGKHSFTLGIEGISPRLRAFLSKSLSDDDIAAALRALIERRVREIKLFFILTAYETPEDLAAFSDFCLRLKAWLGQAQAGTRVIMSFGRLVRMPNTPLAYDRLFLDEAEWRFAADGVAAACRRAQVECRFAFDWPDYLGTQLLAACGHGDAEAVVALACGGLSYHGPWRSEEAARLRAVVDVGEARPLAEKRTFPFVKRAVQEAFLEAQWATAQRHLDKGYCLGAECLGCGACASAPEREALTGRSRVTPITAAHVEAVSQIEAAKRRLVPVFLRVVLPDTFCGHSAAWAAATLMQGLLARHPEQTENLLAVEEALFSAGENEERLLIPAGETVLALKAWDTAAALACAPGAALAAPSFARGQFARATWELRTALPPRDAAQQASAWLTDLRLAHTLRREQDGWQLDLAPAAVKKRCVFEMRVRPEAQGACVTLAFAPKAQVRPLAERLPPLAGQPQARCVALAF